MVRSVTLQKHQTSSSTHKQQHMKIRNVLMCNLGNNYVPAAFFCMCHYLFQYGAVFQIIGRFYNTHVTLFSPLLLQVSSFFCTLFCETMCCHRVGVHVFLC